MAWSQGRLFDSQIFAADVCIARHRGNAESKAANPGKSAKRASHERILAIYQTGDYNAKEVAAKLGCEIHCISGRLAELRHSLGKLRPTGVKRDKSAVLTLCRP